MQDRNRRIEKLLATHGRTIQLGQPTPSAQHSTESARPQNCRRDARARLSMPPYGRQPGLRVRRRIAGPVIALEFDEARRRSETSPAFGVMKDAIASIAPAFLVRSVRTGAEQNACGLQSGMELAQDARQFAARHMKERRIGEDSVKMASRQIKCEKILQPHLATAVDARHFDEAR